jgi:CubicO group peptidase (beta-lactamase class C family)
MLRNLFAVFVLPLTFALTACGGGGSASDPRLAALALEVDAFIQPYLNANGITGGTVAVMKDGQLLYEKGYGHQNLQATIPLRADALFSGASTVKPMTAAAINKLQTAGFLDVNDFVFCRVNNIAPRRCWIPFGWVTSTDNRIESILIRDLISHRGGWDRGSQNCRAFIGQTARANGDAIQTVLRNSAAPCDPLQHDALVKGDLSLTSPPTIEQTIRYFMGADLDYDPGFPSVNVRDRYSNFGYMLLGHIIERASGQSYNSYINSEILGPLGIAANDFKNGNSLLSQADPREPNYITNIQLPSVFGSGFVNVRDGGVNAINWVATATSLMTASALARFASAFKIDTDAFGVDGPTNGQPLAGARNDGFHGGDLPGSAALVRQLSSGITYAVLLNKNDKFEGSGPRVDYPMDMKAGLDSAVLRAGY